MDGKPFILAFLVLGSHGFLPLFPWAGFTGESHSDQYLPCYDCHNKHDGLYPPVKNGQVADRGR